MSGYAGMSTAPLQQRAQQRATWRQTARELGRALRHQRRMTGWSQEELAFRLGTTQGNVSALEQGAYAQGATLHWCTAANDVLTKAQATFAASLPDTAWATPR